MGLEIGSFWRYEGLDLQAFNGTANYPWGYVELMISLRNEEDIWTVNLKFSIVPYKSIYSCILGKPFDAMLDVVASLVHPKLKYHNLQGDSITINFDLKGEKRIYQAL